MDAYVVLLVILTNLLGMLFYSIYLIRGKITPNISTWLIWLFVNILNLFSYIDMSQDLQKSSVAFMFTLATLIILIIALFQGSFKKPEKWDMGMLMIAVAICIIWLTNKDSTQANLSLQIAYIIGIIPTIRGLIRRTITEQPSPWLLWAISHFLGISVILLRWNGNYADLGFSANWVVLNLIVVFIATRNRSLKQKAFD